MTYWHRKRAVITGGSAGLGLAIARTLVKQGARVVIAARRASTLEAAAQELSGLGGDVLTIAADVTKQDDVARLNDVVQSAWGGLDLLCHAAGRSMRGTALDTSVEDYQSLWDVNFLSAVRCSQQFAPALMKSHGHLVLIGSLASKVAPSFIGAYPASKFPLAAFAQQLRVENGDRGLHTLLVCPGPIARDAVEGEGGNSTRYAHQGATVPEAALRPAGGAKVRAIDPHELAEKILRACERRQPELVVPPKARLLFTLAQLSPRLGDWLLRKMTSG